MPNICNTSTGKILPMEHIHTTHLQRHSPPSPLHLHHQPRHAHHQRREAEVGPHGPRAVLLAKVPEDGLGGAGGDVRVRARLARDDGVDVGEAHVVAVEAVGLVDLGDARVAGLDEGDVDALEEERLAFCVRFSPPQHIKARLRAKTHREQCRTVLGDLDHLDRCVVAGLHRGVGR